MLVSTLFGRLHDRHSGIITRNVIKSSVFGLQTSYRLMLEIFNPQKTEVNRHNMHEDSVRR